MANRVEETYHRLHPRLWRALFAYAGDPDTASDAEAEAFSQALRRGDAIRDVDAWVWRASFRIAAGLLQHRSRQQSLTLVDAGFIGAESPADSSVVEFVSQLSNLSDQQRATVVLRYIGNFGPTEIAELLNTTAGSVRVQLHRAHNQLRAELEQSSW